VTPLELQTHIDQFRFEKKTTEIKDCQKDDRFNIKKLTKNQSQEVDLGVLL
jgi:hypothetical protein